MKPIITVTGVSKRYDIGEKIENSYSTIREAATHFALGLISRSKKKEAEKAEIWALKDVNFEVRPGEVLGVIGRNGAGKSTILKVLSRITEPTGGRVELFGRVASLLEVGTGFHPELTGRENVFLNGTILGMKKAEITRKFDEIVSFAEVEKFLDTPVKRYSSGMYMRLAFAVAAHMEPEILLVDEVLAVGDAAFQRKCLGKMEDVARKGRTVVFVSHNLTAMRSLCNRGLVFESGEIVKEGSIQQCVDFHILSVDREERTTFSTREIPRPSVGVDESGALRITRITASGGDGENLFRTGLPICITLNFETSIPLVNVVFGFLLKSSDNVIVFECRSSDSIGVIGDLPAGEYSMSAKIPSNPLNPGIYELSVGARNESKSLDFLPGLMTLRVDSAEQFGSVWLEAPGGLFRVRSDWEMSNIDISAQ